ncbi:hypothetical protein AB0H12_29675 [Actinosynnema sp. NPDC023794]
MTNTMGSSAIDRDVVLDELLVEDRPGDALTITETLAEIDVRLHTVRDTGHESPLRGVHRYVRPDLALSIRTPRRCPVPIGATDDDLIVGWCPAQSQRFSVSASRAWCACGW